MKVLEMKFKKITALFCLLIVVLTSCKTNNKTVEFTNHNGDKIKLDLEVTDDKTKSFQALEYALTPDYYAMGFESDIIFSNTEATEKYYKGELTYTWYSEITGASKLQKDGLNYLKTSTNAVENRKYHYGKEMEISYYSEVNFDFDNKYLYQLEKEDNRVSKQIKTNCSKEFEKFNSYVTSKDFNLFLEVKKFVNSVNIIEVNDQDYKLSVTLEESLFNDEIILESKPDIHLTAESKTGKISNLEFEFKAKRLFNKDYNEDGIVDEIMEIRQGINASINIVYPSKININKLTEDQIKDYKEVATNYQI